MSVSFPGHDPFPAYEDDHDTAEIIMNNYQLTGVYALKPPGAAGFPSAFEMSIVDYEDMPENMRRSWGVFSLGHLKGFVKLEKVEAGKSDLRLGSFDELLLTALCRPSRSPLNIAIP